MENTLSLGATPGASQGRLAELQWDGWMGEESPEALTAHSWHGAPNHDQQPGAGEGPTLLAGS